MNARALSERSGSLAWKVSAVMRLGKPDMLICFAGGIGDDLLCSTMLHELRKRGKRGLWMMTEWPELFENNPDAGAVLPHDRRYFEIASRLGTAIVHPHYTEHDTAADRDAAPKQHILSEMCAKAGIEGAVSLRPYLFLSEGERDRGRLAERQAAIQSSGLSARFAMRNKEWYADRLQAVVDLLKDDVRFVHVGAVSDPPLQSVIDMRGRTSLRETAAILSESKLFVGLAGMLMHLARAVGTRSVIVYGGREAPDQSGYSCNENVYSNVPCAPCWRWNACDFDHECMQQIHPEAVVEAVRRCASRCGAALEEDTDVLPGH